MELIYNTKEISQNIFSLDTKNIVIEPNLQEDLNKLVKTLSSIFPNDSIVRFILKELKNNLFEDVISNYFFFPIISSNLEKILKSKKSFSRQGVFEIFSLYTFYTWISLNNLFLRSSEKYDISILLSLLNNIILVSNNDQKRSKYRIISISCFVDIINTAVFRNAIEKYDLIFIEISELFSENENLPQNTDIIIEILSNKILSPKNNLMNFSNGLINSITQILNRNPKVLNSKIIQNIVKLTKSCIVNLDDIYVNFFLNVARYIPINIFKDIFKSLMMGLLTSISLNFHEEEEAKNVIKKPLKVKNFFKSENNPLNFIFNSPPDLYQIDKIEDEKIFFSDFKVQNLSNFINFQTVQLIEMTKKIISLNAEYAQYFITESFEDLQIVNSNLNSMKTIQKVNFQSKRIFYNQCATVFYLVSVAEKQFSNDINQIINENNSIIFNNKQIFDPNVTFFNQDSNFDIISSLRHFSFHFLLNKSPTTLIDILKENSIYLDLFHECIYRLLFILKNEKIQINLYNLSKISDFLITLLFDFQINLNPPYMNEDIELILIIRKTILYYFNCFLNNKSVLVPSFSSPVFLKHFFILLFEPPIRTNFIQFLYKYLSEVKTLQKDLLNSNIIQLFTTACEQLQQNDAISLLLNILNIFNESLFNNKLLIDIFEPITTNIFNIIMKSNIIIKDNSEQLEDVYLSLILFLAVTYKNNEIQLNNILALESIVIKLVKNKSEDRIMLKFIQIITGCQINDSLPIVEIKQPKIICSFVHVFLETYKINEVIKYISDLCSFSIDNCIKCHEVKLDFLIIDIISKFRESEELNDDDKNNEEEDEKFVINEKLIILLFDLFSKIASVSSSIQVVYRFFALLRLINTKYLPSYHKNAIECLNQILIKSRNYPPLAFPMLPLNMINILNIPIQSIENGFSFAFWISIPSKLDGFIQNVLIISDEEKHIFMLKIVEKVFQVTIQSDNNCDSCVFNVDVPIKKWTMITVTSISDHNKSENFVSLYINKKEFKSEVNFHLFSPRTRIKFLINVSESQENEVPLMGPFLLSKPFTTEEIIQLNNEGIRQSFSIFQDKIVFSYRPQYLSSCFVLESLYKLDEIKEIHDDIILNNKTISFSDLIVHDNNINLILPLFGQMDSKLKSGYKVDIDELRMEILMNLFKLGKPFYNFNGFCAISYHFHNSNQLHISFDLYEKFINILEIIPYKKLQMQLIDSIIMNIELWSIIGAEDIEKIFKNWNQIIYPKYKNIVDLIRSVDWFLFIIHQYYDSLNQLDQTLFYCRKYLFEISYEIYKLKFSQSDLSIIISFISSSKTTLIEKKEMINFLIIIIQNDELINENKINVSQIISSLLTIYDFVFKDNEIIEQIIYLIIIYKVKKYEMKINIHELIQKIIIKLHINQNYFYQENFYSKLINFININKATEFLPILCVNAIYCGTKYLEILLNNIDRNNNYLNNEQSTIYPSLLLFAFFSNKLYYIELIKLNLLLFKEDLIMLINAIDIIGYCCFNHIIYDQIKHDVLYEIMKIYSPEMKFNLNIIFNFIFTRPVHSNSSILNNFINKLPSNYYNPYFFEFVPEKIKEDDEKITENNSNTIQIIQNINEKIKNKLKSTKFMQKIGLRFDNDSDRKWLDLDISKMIISIYQKYHIKQQNELILILIYFINKCDSSFCFNLNSFDIKNTSSYLNAFVTLSNFSNLMNENALNYSNKFLLFYDSCLNDFSSKINDNEINKNIEIKQKIFNNKKQTLNDKNNKIWLTLWNSLTSSGSPWAKSPSKDYKGFENKNDEMNYFIGEEEEKQFHKLIKKIGSGATSDTYKIIDTRTEKVMCKKVLKVKENIGFKELQNAIKEFDVLHLIHHPCICYAIGINTAEIIKDEFDNEITTVALFLEYFEWSLDERIRSQALDNTIKTKIVIEIAQGMSFIHMLGMIHRDLKTLNIMLDSNYNAKLIDFGIVNINEFLFKNYSFHSDTLTKGVGTLAFMSPEMMDVDDNKKYDNKTDVYSFGIVLYNIFVGNLPKFNLKERIEGKPIQLPNPSPSISPFCINLISKCLLKKPEKRPSFNEILQEIRKNSYALADDVDQYVVSSRDQELEEIKKSYQR